MTASEAVRWLEENSFHVLGCGSLQVTYESPYMVIERADGTREHFHPAEFEDEMDHRYFQPMDVAKIA